MSLIAPIGASLFSSDEERVCYVFDRPEESATVSTYVLTENVPLELRSVANVVGSIAAAKLGIDPPALVWFDFPPDGVTFDRLVLDEIPAFRRAPLQGIAVAPLGVVGVNCRQSRGETAETIAHEIYHVARGRDEAAAIAFGKWARQWLVQSGILDSLIKPLED